MDLRLGGKKALIMASSKGIGRAIAESLLGEGASVCLHSRDEQRLRSLAEELGTAHYVVSDLATKGAAAHLVRTALQKMGGIDILVTNTGGPARGNFLEIPNDQWYHDYQSVWMSVVEAMHECLPVMRQQKWGRILLITSVAAREPLPALTTSNGLRAGLLGLAKSISKEYAQHGITINCLLPGYTNTERLQSINLTDQRIRELVPAGRLGDPRELADFATFLASERGGYITGQSIAVDGGFLDGV